jgi:transcriptional regulator with XRE-family HTH domain
METDLSITYIDNYHHTGVCVAGSGGRMTLGALLKDRRAEGGWTQEEIAARAGRYQRKEVDQTHVSHWERDGIKRPTGAQLRMLAHAYELPVVELVIAAGYLRRDDLAGAEDSFANPPPDDPVQIVEQIAALTDKLDRVMRADRESRERRQNTAS